MKIKIANICEYGECMPTSRNFSEGETLLNSNCISKCGRNSIESNEYNIIAFCDQVSLDNKESYKIKGTIDAYGSINTFKCSCKADSREKCSHILAVLLFCSRNDIDKLPILSCTDVPGVCESRVKTTVEQHKDLPLCEIPCFKKTYKGTDEIKLTDSQKEQIEKLISDFRKKQSEKSNPI